MSKLKMNCGYCGRKCNLDKDFCIPQDSVYVCKSCCDWQNRVADLEAKLAEKDKEIESLKIDLEAKDFNINTLMEQRKRKQKFYNQDKISFAVEQLKKVKAELVNGVSPVNLSYTEYVQEVFNKLNNQIEELKKENINDKEKP